MGTGTSHAGTTALAERRFPRKSVATGLSFALAAAVVAIVLPAFTSPAQAACNLSPEGQVLLVSNNVYESEQADARKPADMKRFVARMKKMVPYAPDIVLVQELRASAVAKIRKFLADKFDCDFSIAVNAGKTPWKWLKKYTHLLSRDTAVIVNDDSMLTRKTGKITTSYDRSDAASGETIKPMKSAWAKLVEKDQADEDEEPLRVVAASVHYPRGSAFKNAATNERIKKKWSKKIANKLEGIVPAGTAEDNKMKVIAGDFNTHRYSGSVSNENPAYHLLTHAPYNYTDGIIVNATGGNPNPIDFIFSTGKSVRAGVDTNNTKDESSSKFYSNHDLRWSLITPY